MVGGCFCSNNARHNQLWNSKCLLHCTVMEKNHMLKSLQANFILNTKIIYEKSVIHKVLSIQVVDIAIV